MYYVNKLEKYRNTCGLSNMNCADPFNNLAQGHVCCTHVSFYHGHSQCEPDF